MKTTDRILVLDNYDSFTYNLVHILHELGYRDTTSVIRNDKLTIDEVDEYDRILLSPGPGLPSEAGIMPELVKRYAPTKPILGVCLGHQCIAEAFGASLLNMPEVYHGRVSQVKVADPSGLFEGIEQQFEVCRYHSWIIKADTLPSELKVTAWDNSRSVIMGIRHEHYPVYGVQFHPESVMTEHGKEMIINWLSS